jgi:hypothetical protein
MRKHRLVVILSTSGAVALAALLLGATLHNAVARDEIPEDVLTYYGMSDASAAVAVSDDMFIAADDEDNVLRVYQANGACLPVSTYDLTEFLGVEPEHPEADIEGATTVEDRIYWITSHGRNKDGKMRPNRYRFFATSLKAQNGNVTIEPVGTPCRTLVHNLVGTAVGRRLGLDQATQLHATELAKKQRRNLAPKEQGLNIEALCASADGQKIYIGFRNPRPYDRATSRAKTLVIPLNNYRQVVDKGHLPVFGDPILWDLGGLGIRSMEYSHLHGAYLIVAGPHDEGPGFALYRWSGQIDAPPVLVRRLQLDKLGLTPEALVLSRNSAKILLLSDDGTLPIKVAGPSECMQDEFRSDGTCLNKYLLDVNKKHFRAVRLRF